MTTLMPAVRHTFGERVQKGNCYRNNYKRRSTKYLQQPIVADPELRAFLGLDQAGTRLGFAIAFSLASCRASSASGCGRPPS